MPAYKWKNIMISKNQIKHIRSLEMRKNRERHGMFVAEGPKVVADIMAAYEPVTLIATEEWYQQNHITPRTADATVTEDELRKASFLQHPQQVMAVFNIPRRQISPDACSDSLCLALDRIQDPGNLGTIIRLADWFGIEHIFCSPNTADVYNPKTVQATMGALARVQVHYIALADFLQSLPADIPVYGTFLDGKNIYTQPLSAHGIIVMGNEGNGICPAVSQHINRRLYIPSYPPSRSTSESLNVAIATAVVCAEFRRQAACG